MIAVVVEWNTDADGKWVDMNDRQPMTEDLKFTYPLSLYGPFSTMDEADKWMEDALPDNKDVFDIYALEHDFPKDWPLANPTEYPDGYHRPENENEQESDDRPLRIVHEAPMPFLRAV